MDPKLLLAIMAQRLYEDVKFIANQNPTQIVDDDGTRTYNSLIAKARRTFAHVENIADFQDWAPRNIKYKDALLVAGQFSAMLDALTADERRIAERVSAVTAGPAAGAPAAAANRPAVGAPLGAKPDLDPVGNDSLDSELYDSAPPRRNNDGTIPFTLD
jgi:hypothetical protein